MIREVAAHRLLDWMIGRPELVSILPPSSAADPVRLRPLDQPPHLAGSLCWSSGCTRVGDPIDAILAGKHRLSGHMSRPLELAEWPHPASANLA